MKRSGPVIRGHYPDALLPVVAGPMLSDGYPPGDPRRGVSLTQRLARGRPSRQKPGMQHLYRELDPAPALRPYVECYWRATSAGAPDFRPREPLVPDLRVELIFNAGSAWRWFDDGAASSHATSSRATSSHATSSHATSSHSTPSRAAPSRATPSRAAAALTCIGMRGSALAIEQPGRLDHFAIRFRPAGLAAFVRIPLAELTQRCWDMRELWTDARELEQRLMDARNDAERTAAADEFLLQRVLLDGRAQLARHAVRLLAGSHGQLSIERLAASQGVSYKRLERVFARDVGLSPKHFARVARVQRALELGTARPGAALARLAAESGYADQAHLSRDFSRLIGVSPREFFAARFAVFETMKESGSIVLRPEASVLSKTFKTPGGAAH